METNGAVFLPAAGYRNGTHIIFVGSVGNYWSASFGNMKYLAGYMRFDELYLELDGEERGFGFSVRLVRDAQ